MSEISRLYDEMIRAARIVDVPRLPTTKMVEMHISDVLQRDLIQIMPMGIVPRDIEVTSQIDGDKVVFTAHVSVYAGVQVNALERMKEAIDEHR